MEEKEVKTMTEKAMWDHGLVQKGWTFRFGRGKKQFGLCDYDKKEIAISRPLSSINDKERVMLTVLHEIAHALVGPGNGHNKVWKRKCIEIGGNGKRCWSYENTKHFKDYGDCVLSSRKINGIVYKRGDSIRVKSHRYGEVTGTFKEYNPRNHKYPVIVEIRGRNFKYDEARILPPIEDNKPSESSEGTKYVINKRYLMVMLDGEINTWIAKENKAVKNQDYAEALECRAKAEVIQSIIARHLV